MREFSSLGALALHLATRAVAIQSALEDGLDDALVKIEKTAKDEFGIYQPAVGGFDAWDELADSTKEDRLRQGFTENDPLLRTGKLRDSIDHERAGLEGAVGSREEVMAYEEFGTEKMPPRPVLGPAVFRNKDTIRKLVGAAAVSCLIGADVVHRALGYDFEA